MKTNQKNRFNNSRYNNRNNRVMITRNTALESSGPCGKLHGTALQLCEKYQAAAKDALIQNDLVLAQICLQHADHYMRLQNIAIMNEQAMRSNCNNNNQSNVQQQSNDKQNDSQEPAEELPVIETPKALEEETKEDTPTPTQIESAVNDEAPTQKEEEKPARRKIGAKKLTLKSQPKQKNDSQEAIETPADESQKEVKIVRHKLALKNKTASQTPEANNQPSEEA